MNTDFNLKLYITINTNNSQKSVHATKCLHVSSILYCSIMPLRCIDTHLSWALGSIHVYCFKWYKYCNIDQLKCVSITSHWHYCSTSMQDWISIVYHKFISILYILIFNERYYASLKAYLLDIHVCISLCSKQKKIRFHSLSLVLYIQTSHDTCLMLDLFIDLLLEQYKEGLNS